MIHTLPQLCTGWPVNPHASSTNPHVAFLLPLFFWLSWIFWKCVSDGSPGKRGRKVQEPRTTECWCQKPPWPAEAEEGGHCGGGCGNSGCPVVFQKLRFVALLGPLGCSDFPWILCPKESSGRIIRATRLLHTGDNVLGTITRVCDFETLWMGQCKFPIHRTPNKPGAGATQVAVQTGTPKFLPDIPTEPPPHLEGTSRLC